MRPPGERGVAGIAALDDKSFEQSVVAQGIGTPVGIETIVGKPHHVVAVAVKRGVEHLLRAVPTELGLGREVAREGGMVGVTPAEVLIRRLGALVFRGLRTGKPAIHLDAGGNLKRHIERAATARLRTLRGRVGACGHPHLARETIVHKVVDGILHIDLGRGPRLAVVGIGTRLADVTYVLCPGPGNDQQQQQEQIVKVSTHRHVFACNNH